MKKEIIISLLLIMPLHCKVNANENDLYGKTVTVSETFSVDEVYPGDEFTINFCVYGYSEEIEEIVPFDAVLAIDNSGSMGPRNPTSNFGTDLEKAVSAAKEFIVYAQDASGESIYGDIRIGIVVFNTNCQTYSLSSNYGYLIENLDSIYGSDGLTNIADAMGEAHNLLLDMENPGAVKCVILLTDGSPTGSQYDSSIQYQAISNYKEQASDSNIRYYTIGIGNDINRELLSIIARDTGGRFYQGDSSSLTDFYSHIFEHLSHTLVAGNVNLGITRNSDAIEIIPGTCQLELGANYYPGMDAALFEESGFTRIRMGQMPSDRVATFSYRVKTKQCCSINESRAFTKIKPSRDIMLGFTYGTTTPKSRCVLPDSLTCYKIGHRFIKRYRQEIDEVELILSNYYPDQIFRDINIYEYTSPLCQFQIGSAVPLPRNIIPMQHQDLLYWHFESIQPQSEIVLKFKIDKRVYFPRDDHGILRINGQKQHFKYFDEKASEYDFKYADGTRHSSLIPQALWSYKFSFNPA